MEIVRKGLMKMSIDISHDSDLRWVLLKGLVNLKDEYTRTLITFENLYHTVSLQDADATKYRIKIAHYTKRIEDCKTLISQLKAIHYDRDLSKWIGHNGEVEWYNNFLKQKEGMNSRGI